MFFTVTSVPLGLLLGLGLALALDQQIRGIAIIRTAYFLPVVTSTTAIALVWLWIYSPRGGLLNAALGIARDPGTEVGERPVLVHAIDRR